MHFNDPFTQDDIGRSNNIQETAHMLADSAFEGVRAAHTFQKFYLEPLLQGLINQNPREQALMGLHYRIVTYLMSLRKLNGPIHFQAIAASARSLFELGLDIALFSHDTTNDSLDRLHAFTRVERYRVAKKTVDFFSNYSLPKNWVISPQQSVCADPQEEAQVKALSLRYWQREPPKNWPKHWSRFQDIRSRAHHVDRLHNVQFPNWWQKRYILTYYMLSWHVHSGLTGVTNLRQETFEGFAFEAFQLSTDVVLESYKILGRELRLSTAMPEWDDRLSFLGRVIGLALVDKCLQALGDPMRFRYLEEHEQDD
ncbi:MAG: DUF5677 domain-containing protein [Syntrophales bacterium]|nr:DUF5677 domain-containing protein [Syntrophales bacterium]